MEENTLNFLQILQSYADSAITLIGVYPREYQIHVHEKLVDKCFIRITPQSGNSPNAHPSVSEWIGKIWYTHTVEC